MILLSHIYLRITPIFVLKLLISKVNLLFIFLELILSKFYLYRLIFRLVLPNLELII